MNRFIYICCFFAILPIFGQQNPSFKELRQRLSQETDREKIETYLDISELTIPSDSVLKYLNEALLVSERIKFDSIYPIQFAICVSYYMKGDFNKAKQEIRKGLKNYNITKNPEGTLGHINMLLTRRLFTVTIMQRI
ncbi:MAG: hypothetical protein L3J09_03080 [Flavobacteriaceae bacterium]|nr:hypothetical protein [Flavobacteriaceae bacterium]